jgi:hypothetical protein
MGQSYAVSWRNSKGSIDAGRLVLGSRSLRLEGAKSLEIAYDDLVGVSVGRSTSERVGGRATVVLSRRRGRPIWIAPVAQQAALLELHDRLSAVCREPVSAE